MDTVSKGKRYRLYKIGSLVFQKGDRTDRLITKKKKNNLLENIIRKWYLPMLKKISCDGPTYREA